MCLECSRGGGAENGEGLNRDVAALVALIVVNLRLTKRLTKIVKWS